MSGSKDNTLKVWDVETGKCVATLGEEEKFNNDACNIAVFSDGRRAVSAAGSGIILWDLETGAGSDVTIKGRHGGLVRHLAIFPDERHIASAGTFEIKVWDVATGKCVATLGDETIGEECSETVSSLAILDGQRIVSGSDDGILKLWNVEI